MRRAATQVCAVIVSGATLPGQGQVVPRRDQTIELLQADAASVPPELEADILLRLSSLSTVDKECRRELLVPSVDEYYTALGQIARLAGSRATPAVCTTRWRG